MKKKSEQPRPKILSSEKSTPPVIPPETTLFHDDSITVGIAVAIEPSLTYTLEPTFNNRYGYRLSGNPVKIKTALEAIRNNAPVGCRDAIDSIKTARTALFAAKSAGARR
jgi:hypothetical protein